MNSQEGKDTQDVIAEHTEKDDEGWEDSDTTNEWKKSISKHLWEFGDVFSKKRSKRMPARKPYDHSIEFEKEHTLPWAAKLYPLSPKEKNSLDEWITEELRKGYICPLKSPVAAPVFFVKKKDGSLRLVQDYCKLNDITVKNQYPIPCINNLVDSLSQAKVFSKIDLQWGYNNVRIKKGNEWKTAFVRHRGLFEAKVMYFGFTNAPATFPTMMNESLKDLILEGTVMIYLDDILIFTLNVEENR